MALSQLARHGEDTARSGRTERPLVERGARRKAWRRPVAAGKIGVPNGVQRERAAEASSNTRRSDGSRAEGCWPGKREYGRMTERTPSARG